MDKTESTVRNILTAVEAPLYDIGVLSDRGMLPGLDSIPAAAVLDRLFLPNGTEVIESVPRTRSYLLQVPGPTRRRRHSLLCRRLCQWHGRGPD